MIVSRRRRPLRNSPDSLKARRESSAAMPVLPRATVRVLESVGAVLLSAPVSATLVLTSALIGVPGALLVNVCSAL